MKLIMTKGLPASGKSTWAKQFLLEQPAGAWKRVNKDDLRSMLDAGKWSKNNEMFILEIRDTVIETALSLGISVIVDDTNLAAKHRTRLEELAQKYRADFEVKSFDVDVYECIERDAKRIDGLGKDVIWGMWKDFMLPKVSWSVKRTSLPETVICDLEGTLMSREGERVANDIVNLLKMFQEKGRKIVFISEKPEESQAQTLAWLKTQGFDVQPEELLMRKPGETRKEWLVKFELLRDNIIEHWNPTLVLEDQDQAAAMWRAQGLRCMQVAYSIVA